MEAIAVDSSAATNAAKVLADSLQRAQGVYNDLLHVGIEQARQSYLGAQQTYANEVQSLLAELSERTQQMYRAYGESLNAAITSAPGYEQCMAEYRGYLERLNQLLAGTEPAQRARALYDAYLAKAGSQPGEAAMREASESLYKELDAIWKQEPLRRELHDAQGRYLSQLERLSGEVRERQAQAYRDLLAGLAEVWSQAEMNARSQGALARLIAAVRDVLVQCHATVEKASAKAIETMSAKA